MSHAGGLVLVAVGHGRDVGVDVEPAAAARHADAVTRLFSETERQALSRLPRADIELAALRCWTRKEAYVKARGTGLGQALDSFDVLHAPPVDPAAPLEFVAEVAGWPVREIAAGAAYTAALAASPGAGILPGAASQRDVDVLMRDDGLSALMNEAVAAAKARAAALSG